MDYKARFYSPYLNRFIQPDSIIPDLTDTQSWNRYSYVNNNPVNYNDPTGHCGICIAVVFVLAVVGITSGMDDIEFYAPIANAEANHPDTAKEIEAFTSWQSNCVMGCHNPDYIDPSAPLGGPKPETPHWDAYDEAMWGVSGGLTKFFGGIFSFGEIASYGTSTTEADTVMDDLFYNPE